MPVPERVIVYIDYENVRRGAREAFYERWDAPPEAGHFDPLSLAVKIVEAGGKGGASRELVEVRVYRGQPHSEKQPTAHAAWERQTTGWQRDPRVHVVHRVLNYRGWDDGERPREKGVDVALAVDFVADAMRARYDVGILFSADTDLKPALEFVRGEQRGRTEVAAWRSPFQRGRTIRLPGMWCHWLNESVFSDVQDDRDYTRP